MYHADLSRFEACTIKKPKLVDLMRIPEFRARVDAYEGVIDDLWVLQTTRKVEKQLRLTDDYAKAVIEQYGIESLRKHNQKHYYCRRALAYLERTVSANE